LRGSGKKTTERGLSVREILKNLALLVGTIVLTLVVGEIGVRLMEPSSDKQPLYQILKESPRRFAMLPNRAVLRDGAKIHTNSLGFRGGEISRVKPPGTYRIVGLGDSYTFGAGVDYEDTYLRSLEKLLNKSNPSTSIHYESVNLGVSGYNTVQELATLREEGLSLHPDLIIVGYVFNDVDEIITTTGEFPMRQPMGHTSVLTRFIFDLKERSHLFAFISPRLGGILRKVGIRNIGLVGSYTAQFAESSRGWKRSQEALLEMDALARSVGSKFAVVVFPAFVSLNRENYPLLQYHHAVTKFCQDHSIPVYDIYLDFEGKKANQFWVSLNDPHPNAAANLIVAEALYRFLTSHHLVLTPNHLFNRLFYCESLQPGVKK
jgi:hypothetical protein